LEALPSFAFAIINGIILGVAFLLVMYKMIDGEMPAAAGLTTMGVILFMLTMSVKPVHPALPLIILVVAITLMAITPFALEQLEKAELRALETDRLIRVYDAFVERPDNTAALFEIAERLYAHGMRANAIAISSAALAGVSQKIDPVRNTSVRDHFRKEEYQLKRWIRENPDPALLTVPACPGCGHVNPPEQLVCEKCGRPYLIDTAYNLNVRPKVYGKLVFAFAAVAGLIVAASAVGLNFSGGIELLMLIVVIGGIGGAFYYLFFRPYHMS